jgi:hypothetical protein
MSVELHPTNLSVYGFCVAWIPGTEAAWTMEQDDEYRNLPAHYMSLAEALDRVAYLKAKGFKARALALVATPTDTAAEFESAKIQPPE